MWLPLPLLHYIYFLTVHLSSVWWCRERKENVRLLGYCPLKSWYVFFLFFCNPWPPRLLMASTACHPPPPTHTHPHTALPSASSIKSCVFISQQWQYSRYTVMMLLDTSRTRGYISGMTFFLLLTAVLCCTFRYTLASTEESQQAHSSLMPSLQYFSKLSKINFFYLLQRLSIAWGTPRIVRILKIASQVASGRARRRTGRCSAPPSSLGLPFGPQLLDAPSSSSTRLVLELQIALRI